MYNMVEMVEIGQIQNKTFFVPYMITVERGLDPAEDGLVKQGEVTGNEVTLNTSYWERGYFEHELLGTRLL